MAELGADIANCVPLYPVTGTRVGRGRAAVAGARWPPSARRSPGILPIMEHCTRCRADAVGLLGEPMPAARSNCALLQAAAAPANPDEDRPYVAVATLEGVLVNQHLGEAERLAIFRPARARASSWSRRAARRRPAAAATAGWPWPRRSTTAGPCWWPAPAQSPRSVLAEQGIQVIMMEGLIEEGLEAVYRGVDDPLPAAERTSLRQRLRGKRLRLHVT